jgi:hypothetical protein
MRLTKTRLLVGSVASVLGWSKSKAGALTAGVAAVTAAGAATVLFAIAGPAGSAFSAGAGTITSPTTNCAASTGCTLTVTGGGFQAGETIDFFLHSSPVALGTATASPSGSFSMTLTVPAATSVGSHQIVATGETSGTLASLPITVSAVTSSSTSIPVSAPSSTGSSSATASGLPFTGVDVGALSGIAAGAFVTGGLFLRASRRRRRTYVRVG